MVIVVNDIVNVNTQNKIMVVNNNSHQNILLIGGCRITPFLNYLLNYELFGNKFNYLCVLVYVPEMIQLSENLLFNDDIKKQICCSTILFSEYIKSYNYFNTVKNAEKSIFHIKHQFNYEIILPNWNNICLYTKELIQYKNLKNDLCKFHNNEISFQEFTNILKKCHENELQRHFNILIKANFIELIDFIKFHLNLVKLSHTLNHPSNRYFLEMFRVVLKKYFNTNYIPQSIINMNNSYEFLGNEDVDTKLTYYDSICLGINIPNKHYLDKNESNKYLLDL